MQWRHASEAGEFADGDPGGAGGDQVTESVRRVVAADAVVIRVDLKHILGPVGIVLEAGERLEEAGAAPVDEQRGFDAGRRIAEAAKDGGPAVYTIGVGGAQGDVEAGVGLGDGEAVALAGEDVRAGDKTAEADAVLAPGLEGDPVTLEHLLDRRGVPFGHPTARRVFIHNKEVAIAVVCPEQGDGVMIEAVVEGGDPFHGAAVLEIINDMDLAAEGGEELAGGDVPIAVEPGPPLPAGEAVERGTVFGVSEGIIINGGGDETRDGFLTLLKRVDEGGAEPGMADAAGIGGSINAGTPAGLGRPAAGDDVRILTGGERGGFLDADDVVFEAEVGINVLLALEMAGDDAGAVGKGEDGARGGEVVGQAREKAAAEVLEVLEVGFADLAEEETFETGETLAIVHAHLREQPKGFAATAGAAEADGGGPSRRITETGGGAGRELPGLEDDAGADEVLHLIQGTTRRVAGRAVIGGSGQDIGRVAGIQ